MKALAFTQCMWFPPSSVPKIKAAFARHARTPEDRSDLIARYLFFRCLSGKRLKAAFGDLCDDIIWEEVSTEIGDRPSAVFPPDLDHMRSCISHHKPDIVIAFGKVAASKLREVWQGPAIITCHPAARQQAPRQLADAAKELRGMIHSAIPPIPEKA